MKKMNKKVGIIASAIATIAVCSSMVVGSTYALFTSESEVNIAVTAANVEVIASIENVKSYTYAYDEEADEAKLVESNSAKLVGNELTLNNVLPGDKVEFDIVLTNKSTVSVLYRTNIECTEGELLMSALKFTLGETDYSGLKSYSSAWGTLSADKKTDSVHVVLELPLETGNEYKNLSTKIAYSVNAVQGNVKPEGYESEKVSRLYYVHDTEGAQAMLDSAHDGDIIVLKAGNYDTLYFACKDLNAYIRSSDFTPSKAGEEHIRLYRTYKDVTLMGEDGAVVNAITHGETVDTSYDGTEVRLENVTLKNLTVKSGISFNCTNNSKGRVSIDGLTLDGCKTTDEDGYSSNSNNSNRLLYVWTNPDDTYKTLSKNITVKNCEVYNRYQGVYLRSVENATIENNLIDTVVHNAIAVQSAPSSAATPSFGTIVIKNNVIKNGADRAIRFGYFEEGSITITGNSFINSGDGNGEVYKAQSIAEGVAFKFEGNTAETYGIEREIALTGNTVAKLVAIDGLYIVSNTEEAQAALDNATVGDTIILKAGNYGKLWIRQSKKSVEDENGYTEWAHTYVKRTISNLSIIGEEGTVVDGIELGSTLYNSGSAEGKINPVTGGPTKAGIYYASWYITNISFSNLTLKNGIYMTLEGWTPDNYINGIKIDNCKTVDNGLALTANESSNRLVDIRGSKVCPVSNLVVTNCQVNHRFQGVYLQYVNNVTVEGCSFDTIQHNAIAVQGGCSGNIVIKDNYIVNDNDRALRLGTLVTDTKVNVEITGNVMVDSGDKEGELLKGNDEGELTNENVTISIHGNYWNGLTPAAAINKNLTNIGVTDTEPLTEIPVK